MSLNLVSATGISNMFADSMLSLFFVLSTVVCIAIAIWLTVRSINIKKGTVSAFKPFLIIIAVGVALRIAFALLYTGNRIEHGVIYYAIDHWNKHGADGYLQYFHFRENEYFYPIAYYCIGFLGSTMQSLGFGPFTSLGQLVVKLPLILADVITAVILYRAGKRYANERVGAILGGLVMICPLFIFTSSIWGSVYSLLMPFLLGSLYFLVKKNYPVSILLYSLSMLLARDATYLFPLLAVYYAYVFIKAVISYAHKDENASLWNVLIIPVSVVACTALNYLICLPINHSLIGFDFIRYIYYTYIYQLTNFQYFANNSLSLYNMMNRDTIDITFKSGLYVGLFAALIAAFSVLLYLSRTNRATLTLAVAYLIFLLHTCYLDMAAPSIVVMLPVLLLAFALIRDKRILKIFAAEGLLALINMCAVFVSGGYFNNLPKEYFTPSPTGPYTGIPRLIYSTGGTVTIIILSVLSIAVLLYTTKVIINIVMQNKQRTLGGNERIDAVTAVSDFLKP